MSRLERALASVQRDLAQLGADWALVGGLAVSVRTEPRTTRDIDLAVAVENDQEAERIVRDLVQRGYRILREFEQEAVERLATVELAAPGDAHETMAIDLLFATSGIEPEIVRGAERTRIFGGLVVPVAGKASLIALKILSKSDLRGQDHADLLALLREAVSSDLDEARELLDLISSRGFSRGKNLRGELESILARLRQGSRRS